MDSTPNTAGGMTDVLTDAATVAGYAPSIHNTQPWRWRIHGTTADLYADTSRQLRLADPDRRMLTISCGLALHHARVALADAGIAVQVDLLPTEGDLDHLARVAVTGRQPATPAAQALYETLLVRRTDRRPLLDEPIPAAVLHDVLSTARSFGIGTLPLTDRDVTALAGLTEKADRDVRMDAARRTELAAWADEDHRPPYAGIPLTNLPNRGAPTIVPARDFGHIGTLPTAGGHDTAATYAILYGPDDSPGMWLRAGEALSAIWLAATERGIALLPLSAAVEYEATRRMLGQILAGVGYPAIAIRLGMPNPNQPVPPTTPRLPAAATIEIV
jgi:nitroreductase